MNNIRPDLKWITNTPQKPDLTLCHELFAPETARLSRRFHRQIPGFHMSPLLALPNLAQMFGVGGIWVKDEAVRLQLNSFKVLGGSYAVYKYLKTRLGQNDTELTYAELTSSETRQKLGRITFATATDGNHGRGIAWAAQKLGHDCVVYVHAETSQPRIEAIRSYGATVKIVAGNYDDAVRQIVIDAEKKRLGGYFRHILGRLYPDSGMDNAGLHHDDGRNSGAICRAGNHPPDPCIRSSRRRSPGRCSNRLLPCSVWL